jgi:uncharacterized protein
MKTRALADPQNRAPAQVDPGVEALQRLLTELARVGVAVSGGVDSLTLGILAGRTLGKGAVMFHARSAAVPPAATGRVRTTARAEGWTLREVDAGEFADEAYLGNPYRRCFHCKSHLYRTLAARGAGILLSGTNTDDLGDFRPGLEAAREHGVRHPFVECGMDKAAVRRTCRVVGYPNLAELPAAPCLSSRVETGVRIRPDVLRVVDGVETMLRERLRPTVVRCRVRRHDLCVQLDQTSLETLSATDRADWSRIIRALAVPLGLPRTVIFEPYRMGSAFVPAT